MSAHSPVSRFAAVSFLLILGWLQFSTLGVTSPTMDEPSHLVSGYAFLTRGDTRIKLNSPILNNLIGAIPLLLEPDLRLAPPDDPAWDKNDHNSISDAFVWANTASPFRLIYMARFPFMAIGWLLGALIFRWGRERGGLRAGLFALVLYVFCPNLLAHSRFVMTDFAPSAFAAFALYSFDRSTRQPDNRAWRVAAGVTLGLALTSKFSLVVLVIALPILAFSQRSHLSVFVRVPIIFVIAAVSAWGVYAFQIGPVSAGGVPVPAPGFWGEVESARYYLDQPWPNYLFGQISETGWWYYFPIAFVLKTPLPVLILLALALSRTLITRSWQHDAVLLLPSFLLFFSLLFSTNNLGYRYLLPLLPIIFVYVSGLFTSPTRVDTTNCITLSRHLPFSPSPWLLLTLCLLAWHILGTLSIYPYYLTFFNEIAGGPGRGRYILSDSNIDWGQDLVGLKHYVEQHHIDRIKLSYFGIAHPASYGLAVEALPPVRTAMHDQGAWWLYTYYPPDPAPGVYAISVANLMGGLWIDQNAYAYFRDRRPDTTIGNSIYMYTIPARSQSVNLSLSGMQLPQIDPDTYAHFGTNDVRPRWFDATTSLIASAGKSWIALADRQPLAPEFAAFFNGIVPEVRARLSDEDQQYSLYTFDLGARMLEAAGRSEQVANGVKLPVAFGETAELIGYNLAKVEKPSQGLRLISYWRAGNRVVTPLQLFVHAMGPDDQIVAQEDRLDVPAYGWRAGDVIMQISRLNLPADSGSVSIEIGLYNPDSGERLPAVVDSREIDRHLLLGQVKVK